MLTIARALVLAPPILILALASAAQSAICARMQKPRRLDARLWQALERGDPWENWLLWCEQPIGT